MPRSKAKDLIEEYLGLSTITVDRVLRDSSEFQILQGTIVAADSFKTNSLWRVTDLNTYVQYVEAEHFVKYLRSAVYRSYLALDIEC